MEFDQSSNFISEMIPWVAQGRILPAIMQRPYRWTKDDVLALCDSIMSGFPIGGFLLWEPRGKFALDKVARMRLGPIEAAEPEQQGYNRPYYMLLDGQNRLASFAWMMHQGEFPVIADASPEERSTWLDGDVLVLDYEARGFKFVPKNDVEVGMRIPAWAVASTSSSNGFRSASNYLRARQAVWEKQFSDRAADDFFGIYDDAKARFNGARVTCTAIVDATPDEALHAFIRICKVGVPMSEEDFRATIDRVKSLDTKG